LVEQAVLGEHAVDLAGNVIRTRRLRRHRAPQRRDAGGRAAVEPRAMKLVVARRGAEVPDDRLAPAREQAEAGELVVAPGPDRRRGDVADVARVEAEHRPEVGALEVLLGALEALAAKRLVVDPLLPVDPLQPV